MTKLIYTFSEHESDYAYETWGANCGPNALAFALQMPLEAVRPHIPQFDERRYTSPSMMAAALDSLKRRVVKIIPERKFPMALDRMFHERQALVRVQWTGPWIVDGKPQKWAARQTHWIVCWLNEIVPMVFDVNGGIKDFGDWHTEIVPPLAKSVPRCDGGWYPANIWRLV
jgi:hypothetical protein